jgi:hypothetical protein
LVSSVFDSISFKSPLLLSRSSPKDKHYAAWLWLDLT